MHTHLPLFTSFLKHGQAVIHTISTALATELGLAPDAFTSRQSPERLSDTVVRLIKGYASRKDEYLRISIIQHTDFGTVTLLVNVLGGLKILTPGKAPIDQQEWLYVRPIPGCLVVNLGDAVVQWTGGLL